MARRIIIQATKGRPDSLKHDVKIAFSLMPEECTGSPTYVAFATMSFTSDSEEYRELGWGRELAFATHKVSEHDGKKWCALGNDRSPVISVGKTSTMSASGVATSWSEFTSQPFGGVLPKTLASARASGSIQDICLVKPITCGSLSGYMPIAAWQPMPTSRTVSSSSELSLQAFSVDGKVSGGAILKAEDRRRPLFAKSISCDALPDSSAWRLTEDDDGTIHLKEADLIDVLIQRNLSESLGRGTGTLARHLGDMKRQLETVVKSLEDTQAKLETAVRSLEDTQRRLAVIESSSARNQFEILETHKSLTAVRVDMSRLIPRMSQVINPSGSSIRPTAAEKFKAKGQENHRAPVEAVSDLFRPQGAVQDSKHQVSAMEGCCAATADSGAHSSGRTTNTSDEPFQQPQGDTPTEQASASVILGRGSRLNSAPLAGQVITNSPGTSAYQAERILSTTEEGLGHVHERLVSLENYVGLVAESAGFGFVPNAQHQSPGIQRSSNPGQVKPTLTNQPLSTIRRQVAALDLWMPTMVRKVQKLKGSLKIVERRVPVMSERLVRLRNFTEHELSALRILLSMATEDLMSLQSRVAIIEMRTEYFGEPCHRTHLSSAAVSLSQSSFQYN